MLRDVGHYLMNENHPLILVRLNDHHHGVTKIADKILRRSSSCF